MFPLLSAETTDGQKIPCSAGRQGDGSSVRPLDTGKYAKAKELAAPRGSDYIGYVDGEQTITVSQ
jgi:hypothetical protein